MTMSNKSVGMMEREKAEQDTMIAAFLAKGGVIQQIPPSAWDEAAEVPKKAPRVIGL
jgi:hypothetical protein